MLRRPLARVGSAAAPAGACQRVSSGRHAHMSEPVQELAPRSRRALLAAAAGAAAAAAATIVVPATTLAADPDDVVKNTDDATTAVTAITQGTTDTDASRRTASGRDPASSGPPTPPRTRALSASLAMHPAPSTSASRSTSTRASTATRPSRRGSRRAGAGSAPAPSEVALLVEDAVVGEKALPVERLQLAVRAHGAGVEEVAVEPRCPDERGQTLRLRRNRAQRLLCGADEAGVAGACPRVDSR